MLGVAESGLYALVSLVLVAIAVVLLADSAWTLAHDASDDVKKAVEESLDALLLVFIIVELLSAVRATVRERQLVAEPFLLVGIIASIKEIVVVAAFADEHADVGDAVLQIGVLGAVIVGLAIATLLVRLKEREPAEGDN